MIADKLTRVARNEAHQHLDRLWQTGRIRRREVYGWLAEAMGLSPEAAHVSLFSFDQCQCVIRLAREKLEEHVSFQKAQRTQRNLRIGLIGPPGAGKTYTSLAIARGLAGPDGTIALLDTENAKAAHYADIFAFDHAVLSPPYTPERYLALVKEASAYTVLIADSLSHEWAGEGGLLEDQDRLEKSGRFKSSFQTWGEITPRHNRFLEGLQDFPSHLICTLRTKIGYAMEQEEGRKASPKRVGLAPIQREGIEYEFDFLFDINPMHTVVAARDNAGIFKGRIIESPGPELGKELRQWNETGVVASLPQDTSPAAPAPGTRAHADAQRAAAKEFVALWEMIGREKKNAWIWLTDHLGREVGPVHQPTLEEWAKATEALAAERQEDAAAEMAGEASNPNA